MNDFFTGGSHQTVRSKEADELISRTFYDGKRRDFPFHAYRRAFEHAFRELEECGEPVCESTKVRKFMNNITDERLASNRGVIFSQHRHDFQGAADLLSLLVAEDDSKPAAKRTISKVEPQPKSSSPQPPGQSSGGRGGGRQHPPKSNQHSIPDAVWRTLSKEQRDLIRAHRRNGATQNTTETQKAVTFAKSTGIWFPRW